MITISSVNSYGWAVNYDSFEDAYEGTINTRSTMFLNTGYDYDYLHFRVPIGKGGAYNMYSSYYSTYNLDTYGKLYEEQGMLWWHDYVLRRTNNNSGYGNNFMIKYDLNGAEDYYLAVRPYLSSYSGVTYIYFEENIDKYSSENGAFWVANSSYSNTTYRYLTKEMISVYFFAIANPTLWEQIEDAIALGGLEFLGGYLLESLIVAAGLASLPATAIAAAVLGIATFVIDWFVPTTEERIVDACDGIIHEDANGVKTLTCNYETRVINENYPNMERYSSSIYVGVTRQRGTWQDNS